MIRKVTKKFLHWKLKNYREDENGAVRRNNDDTKLSPTFDLTWHDLPITADFFSKLLPYQKVNMYPGMSCISKKHNLAQNLNRLQKHFGPAFDFFPRTWVLPIETLDLRTHFTNNQGNKVCYIVKPDSLCQGKGIFLSRSVEYILEVCSN